MLTLIGWYDVYLFTYICICLFASIVEQIKIVWRQLWNCYIIFFACWLILSSSDFILFRNVPFKIKLLAFYF